MERMLILRKCLLPHIADIGVHRIGYHLFQVSVAFNEFGREITGHAQQVVHHQNLTVAVRTGPNPNGRNGQHVRYLGSQVHGDAFQDHDKRAGIGDGFRVFDEPFPRTGLTTRFLALDLIAAHAMHRLRRQADMAHHRDIHIHDGLDNPGDVDPTFQFDGLGPPP